MKAYSVDFRQKIIDTYQNTGISQRALAQRFGVALSFVTKLLKQWRETGTLEAKPRPGRPRKVNQEHEKILIELVEEHNDWTLAEYQEELEKRTQVQVSTTTICRILQNRDYTVKKNNAPDRKRE